MKRRTKKQIQKELDALEIKLDDLEMKRAYLRDRMRWLDACIEDAQGGVADLSKELERL